MSGKIEGGVLLGAGSSAIRDISHVSKFVLVHIRNPFLLVGMIKTLAPAQNLAFCVVRVLECTLEFKTWTNLTSTPLSILQMSMLLPKFPDPAVLWSVSQFCGGDFCGPGGSTTIPCFKRNSTLNDALRGMSWQFHIQLSQEEGSWHCLQLPHNFFGSSRLKRGPETEGQGGILPN